MIPKSDSIADKICLYINKHGKCSREQLVIAMEGRGHMYESVRVVIRDLVDGFQIRADGDGYVLCDLLQKYYAAIAPEVYVGEVAGPRTAPAFKPLTKMPWSQRLDKLRDWSYKNGSTGLYVGYVI